MKKIKKVVLTVAVALFCLNASAQYRVISNVAQPAEGESWSVDNFTESMGIGYHIDNEFMIGMIKNGDDYDFMGRYNLSDDLYLSLQTPTENSLDSMTVGIGFSINIWDKLYIEPNYTRTDEESRINVGLSYKL